MKQLKNSIWLALCFSLSFCSMVKDGKSDIKQGVFGKVTWMEGNFMPSTDRQDAKISAPAQRTVYIYALTKLSETEGQAPLFSKINKAVVAKVKTNKEGYFQCKLPPGKYSIFTFETESAQFFANAFDGDGSITPFEVKANEVTTIDININYKAFY